MKSEAKNNRSKGQLLAIVAATVVGIAGIGLWVFQLSAGMVNTNMRNADPWGLYIINFMLLVGLSAGGLIISSAPKVFALKGFGGISKIAVWISICCTVLAIVFVVVDLGSPLRIWELLAYANFSSPLMWDIIILSIYLIVSIVYLWATIRVEKGQGSKKSLRVLSVIALGSAIMVHTITAWIFGLQGAHEFWHTALLGPWFVSSALVSGLALVLIVIYALKRAGYLQVEKASFIKMVKLLGIFTIVDLYFFACDLLTSGFPGSEGAEIVALLVFGPLAPFFWLELLAGFFAMLVAFHPKLRTTSFIVVAAILSIIGIFCKRVQLLIGGFQVPNVEYVGIASGPALSDVGASTQSMYSSLVYFPAPLELGVVLGVFALGVALVLVGLRILPLRPVEENK